MIASCTSRLDERATCTRQTVGAGDGVAIVTVTLLIPDQILDGTEITNGGVLFFGKNCGYALNAMISNDIAKYLINGASGFPLRHEPSNSRVAEAQLAVVKHFDGMEFDVAKVLRLSPVTVAPTFTDAKYFQLVGNGS